MTIQKQNKLFEGLRKGDLFDIVDSNVTIDRYKSKMGEDDQVVVLGFKALHKEGARDLVEFIESGYDWVLDATKVLLLTKKVKLLYLLNSIVELILQQRL